MTKKSKKRRKESRIKDMLMRQENFKYRLILEGVAVGLLAGMVSSAFRWSLIKAEDIRDLFLDGVAQRWSLAFLGVFLLAVLTLFVATLLRREPLISGSGIPQVEGELHGRINANWLQVLIAKFLGAVAAIGGGLSLGREGPSIQLGAMVGKGFSRVNNRLRTEEKLLMTCGAGAGLAAAFSAPLAGVVFSLEELHKSFSTEILLSTMASAITADWIASYIFGLRPVFDLTITNGLPLSHYWMVIVLGTLLGAFGVFYNKAIAFSQNCFVRIRKGWLKAAIPCGCIILLAAFYPTALGSGHSLVGHVGSGSLGIWALAILLTVKFVFSVLSFGTGAPGGIFLPLLVLGAVSGGFFTETVSAAVGYTNDYVSIFVILGMAGYFAAIVRAPITGIILISEMTGTLSNLLSLSLVSLIAYMTAELLGGIPVYDQLLARLLQGENQKRPKKSNKIFVESQIQIGSYMEGRALAEIGLPAGNLIVSVRRGGREVVPSGQTVLESGDNIVILCNEGSLTEVNRILDKKCRSIYMYAEQAETEQQKQVDCDCGRKEKPRKI